MLFIIFKFTYSTKNVGSVALQNSINKIILPKYNICSEMDALCNSLAKFL